jgi:hypothetical protein
LDCSLTRPSTKPMLSDSDPMLDEKLEPVLVRKSVPGSAGTLPTGGGHEPRTSPIPVLPRCPPFWAVAHWTQLNATRDQMLWPACFRPAHPAEFGAIRPPAWVPQMRLTPSTRRSGLSWDLSVPTIAWQNHPTTGSGCRRSVIRL